MAYLLFENWDRNLGMIKPDVVEYGGGLSISKTGNIVSIKNELSPVLVRSTLHGGSAIGNDIVELHLQPQSFIYCIATLETLSWKM